MKSGLTELMKAAALITAFIIGSFLNPANAQNTDVKSRIAVSGTGSKTKIWVSDFPKNTSIIVTDSDNNLLSITSTNNYGAAFLILPVNVKSSVTVKTLDGDITATNTVVEKNAKPDSQIVSTVDDVNSTKA